MLRPASTLLALATLASCSLTMRQEKQESCAGCACAGATTAAATGLPAWVDAPNFQILNERVGSSGPPTPEAVAGLRARGYGMVIDLRTAKEPGVAGARAAAEAAGLRYVHIPVAGLTFDLTDAAKLNAALASAPAGDVLLHCGSGARAGALWGLAQGLERGLTPEQAAELARRSGRTVSAAAAARVADEMRQALAKTSAE